MRSHTVQQKVQPVAKRDLVLEVDAGVVAAISPQNVGAVCSRQILQRCRIERISRIEDVERACSGNISRAAGGVVTKCGPVEAEENMMTNAAGFVLA